MTGVSLRELFDATVDDRDFVLFVESVAKLTAEIRKEAAEEASRR